MKINDLVNMALKNLFSRKLRTFLTVLGVVIGSISIILMISLGNGITASNESFIKSMGSVTEITVSGGYDEKTGKTKALDITMVDKFKTIKNVTNVMGTLNLNNYQFKANRYMGYATIKGIDPRIMEDFGFEVQDGRLLQQGDKLIAIFGSNIAEQMGIQRGDRYIQAKDLDLKTARLSIVSMTYEQDGTAKEDALSIKYGGTLKESQNWEQAYSMYMPIDEVRKLLVEQDSKLPTQNRDKNIKVKLDNITVKVNDIDSVKAVKDEINTMGFQTFALTDYLDQMKQATQTIQMVFGGIGGVSLLVAAIGISNTMVMSIHERTKEIGVMKVIGAAIGDIQRLFLVEASMIGLFGGILGIFISYLISFIINHLGRSFMAANMGTPTNISIIPISLAIASLAFSSLIGLVAGYFPAKRAMKLSALDAIRAD